MTQANYRPWGLVPWIFDKLSPHTWDFLGCVSAEDRCTTVFAQLLARGAVKSGTFFKIADPPSRFSGKIDEKSTSNLYNLMNLENASISLVEHDLLEISHKTISGIRSFLTYAGPDIIIDISSLPKKFFFPIVKLAMASVSLRNLVITYTVPRGYALGPLTENPQPWQHLPLFAMQYPEPMSKKFIVGIGFEPLGLPDLLQQEYRNISVRLLFPFPPGPPTYQRTWEFVRRIESSFPEAGKELIRVDFRDAPEAFSHLLAATDRGKQYAILAPYGPKPISLGMSIFASLYDAAVFYTQPTTYHSEYSIGVADRDGIPESYAYCIVLNGKNLYKK